jgi:hypothetical protein
VTWHVTFTGSRLEGLIYNIHNNNNNNNNNSNSNNNNSNKILPSTKEHTVKPLQDIGKIHIIL